MVAKVDLTTAMQHLDRLNQLVCSIVDLEPGDPEFGAKFEQLQNDLRHPQEGTLSKEALRMVAQLLSPEFGKELKALEESFSSAVGTN